MISLQVHFSKYDIQTVSGSGSVNHSMFYLSDPEMNTVHRIHCALDTIAGYYVENKIQKQNAPRSRVGEGFEISLQSQVQTDWSGAELAEWLAELPAPGLGGGGCQWWILTNLVKMEKDGLAETGTTIALLADPRMDSGCLMEFSDARNELQANLAVESVVPSDVDFLEFSAALSLAGMKDGNANSISNDLDMED